MFGEEQVGPVADEDFRRLVYDGKLKPNSKILCPSRTKGKWIFLETLPALLKLMEHGSAEREKSKQLAKEHDREIKNERKIARREEEKAREQAAEYTARIQESRAVSSPQLLTNNTRRVGEYRRTCRSCGKIWHSLLSRERQLNYQEFSSSCDSVAHCCNPSARLQAQRNQHDNQAEIVRLKRCPECNSSNYDEVVV